MRTVCCEMEKALSYSSGICTCYLLLTPGVLLRASSNAKLRQKSGEFMEIVLQPAAKCCRKRLNTVGSLLLMHPFAAQYPNKIKIKKRIRILIKK